MLLKDGYQRRFHYLRLSVTERCNFKCTYCLPNGYQKKSCEPDLSLSEIDYLIQGFVKLGIRKVRLTGGEPTLRKDIIEIAQMLSMQAGIEEVALSTNGYRLGSLAGPLLRVGVKAINLSLDSLDPANFQIITGFKKLDSILSGLNQVLDLGFEKVKINVVLLRDRNSHELELFQDWIRNRPISVRFIELMQTGENEVYFKKHHVSVNAIREQLIQTGWSIKPKKLTDGPAQVYGHPDYLGMIGLIAPYSPGFCEGCNRLRVTSKGALKLCLFGDSQESLRDCLSDISQQGALLKRVQTLVTGKAVSHFLQQGRVGNTLNFSGIGG